MRWLAMLLLGLAIGALGAVTVVGAMRQETPLRKALMAVSSQQLRVLRAEQSAGRCHDEAVARRLQAMRALSHDFEAAFLPIGRDALFRERLSSYAAALDRASPTADCQALGVALRDVSRGCKACHDDFRSP